ASRTAAAWRPGRGSGGRCSSLSATPGPTRSTSTWRSRRAGGAVSARATATWRPAGSRWPPAAGALPPVNATSTSGSPPTPRRGAPPAHPATSTRPPPSTTRTAGHGGPPPAGPAATPVRPAGPPAWVPRLLRPPPKSYGACGRGRPWPMALRVLVAWCPDWPVQAAGFPYEVPVAVMDKGRVVACSPAARAEGVTTGLRRREAQRRCTGLVLVDGDPDREAGASEAVVAAAEALAPKVEILRPGECAFAAHGAARFHGGEQELVAKVTAAVDRALGGRGRCRAGIADGVFAAGLAARHGMLVPAGATPGFLAPFSVATLDRPDLADLLTRLGLHPLGQLAALPGADLAARFGPEGVRAHRLASGED